MEGVDRPVAQLYILWPEILEILDNITKLDMLLLVALVTYLDELQDDGRMVLQAEFSKRLVFIIVHSDCLDK